MRNVVATLSPSDNSWARFAIASWVGARRRGALALVVSFAGAFAFAFDFVAVLLAGLEATFHPPHGRGTTLGATRLEPDLSAESFLFARGASEPRLEAEERPMDRAQTAVSRSEELKDELLALSAQNLHARRQIELRRQRQT